MSRISIDVTPEEHQRLKALAALQGKTIKEFVLASTLGRAAPGSEEDRSLAELKALLEARILQADREGYSLSSAEELFDEGASEARAAQDA